MGLSPAHRDELSASAIDPDVVAAFLDLVQRGEID